MFLFLQETAHKVLGSNMPMYYPCNCRYVLINSFDVLLLIQAIVAHVTRYSMYYKFT